MGNPLLSEQVKIKNPRRLAQLLEAYASVNDLDAIDVTLSLSNHSSSFVRAAARSALGHYGRNAFWPARRRYENAFGDEPDGTMEVEAILEALYTHFDNQRLKRSRELFEKGEVARGAGNFEEMAAAYKEVLKAEPMFPRRSEMARGFLDLAFSLDDEDQQQKQEAIALALRLAEPDSETARIAEAERLWLQAERLQEEGLAAMALYRRVLELSPDHAGAREMVRILSPDVEGQGALIVRAVPVSFVIFLGCVLIFMRLRTRA